MQEFPQDLMLSHKALHFPLKERWPVNAEPEGTEWTWVMIWTQNRVYQTADNFIFAFQEFLPRKLNINPVY